jgi:hypothetical protein
MMLMTDLENVALVLGLALSVIRRGQSGNRGYRGHHGVDEAIQSIAESLSISNVPSQFASNFELLFDIFLFEATSGSTGAVIDVLITSLKEQCKLCGIAGETKESAESRLRTFSAHVTKRICQRLLGKSDQLYNTLCRSLATLSGMTVQTQCGSQVSADSSAASRPPPVPIPTPYVCWILEAVTAAMGHVGKLNIAQNLRGNYHIYRRLQPLCELLHVAINAILVHSRVGDTAVADGGSRDKRGRERTSNGTSFSSMSSGESGPGTSQASATGGGATAAATATATATVIGAAMTTRTDGDIDPASLWAMNMLGEHDT